MKKVRWGLFFPLICICAFVLGCAVGFVRLEMKNKEELPAVPIENDVVPALEEEETLVNKKKKIAYYMVKVTGEDMLLISFFDNGSENVVERISVNKNTVPAEEMKNLEEGMMFLDVEEALMMMESYVS